jgi:hypothetical protein
LTSSEVCGVAERTLTHTFSGAAVVDVAPKEAVAESVVDVETGVCDVSEEPVTGPACGLGVLDGVAPAGEVDFVRLAAGMIVVAVGADPDWAVSANTATPPNAMSAAMVRKKIARDGRAGMELLVEERGPSSLVSTSFQNACGLRRN